MTTWDETTEHAPVLRVIGGPWDGQSKPDGWSYDLVGNDGTPMGRYSRAHLVDGERVLVWRTSSLWVG